MLYSAYPHAYLLRYIYIYTPCRVYTLPPAVVKSLGTVTIMRTVLLVASCLVAVCAAGLLGKEDPFAIFKYKFNKNYGSESMENHRRKVFENVHKLINKHNQLFEKGEVSFKLAINHFADMMDHEFTESLLGYNNSLRTYHNLQGSQYYRRPHGVYKRIVDWRKKGAVTEVKDQGHCGGCWAFSTTGALEGQMFLRSGKLVSLSEQNLLDCTYSYGNNGCHGGIMEQAFQYVAENGIDTELSYPYEGQVSTCRFQNSTVGTTATGYAMIPSGDEESLLEAVATVGPVSVAIDGNPLSFRFYSSGIYHDPECNNEDVNHAVLVVGYGVEMGQKYWLVKNSWGNKWGEDGYIRMSRGRRNNCGIATQASFPVVKSD